MNLAIIDLDGVIANNTARFERGTRGDGSINWRVVFDPALVELDVLIEGAKEAVEALNNREDLAVLFLTSRPESMRAATEAWLARHDLGVDRYQLLMKPKEAQFIKTTTWKADVVRRLAAMGTTDALIFIDDEEGNRAAVETLQLEKGIVCHACLKDALA